MPPEPKVKPAEAPQSPRRCQCPFRKKRGIRFLQANLYVQFDSNDFELSSLTMAALLLLCHHRVGRIDGPFLQG